MSRAARQQYEQDQATGNNLRGQLTTAAGNINAQAGQIKGLSPADEAAYTRQMTSGTAAAFGQGRQRSTDLAARTGSPAGLQEINANLTRGQAQQNAVNTGNALQYFRNANNQAAMERAGVFSQGAQPTEAALGSNTQLQGALTQQAYAPGLFSQILGSVAGGIGGGLGTAIGKKF